jgi:hypothetical protein
LKQKEKGSKLIKLIIIKRIIKDVNILMEKKELLIFIKSPEKNFSRKFKIILNL